MYKLQSQPDLLARQKWCATLLHLNSEDSMRNKFLAFALALVTFQVLNAGANKASADSLLTFGQTSNANTIVGTKTGPTNDFGFTVVGTDIQVNITQINGQSGLSVPLVAYLTVDLSSIGNAQSGFGGSQYGQEFTGLIRIFTGAGGTGTNILSTTKLDGWLIGGADTILANFQNINSGVGFSSDVFHNMSDPLGITLNFNNVNPAFGLSGNSLGSFNASVAGGASASLGVPEPTSILTALVGLSLVVPITRRRSVKNS